MSRSARPMRGRKASRRVDTGAIEAMVRDGRIWTTLGKVMKPDSANEHWKIKTLDDGGGIILIEVETLPDSMDLTCRLGTSGFGGGGGLWAIPPVGSIVVVAVPAGEVEFLPTIVGVLDNNAAPVGLSDTLTLLVDDRTIAVRTPKLQLGDSDATEAFIKGTSRRAHESALTGALSAMLVQLQIYITGIQAIAELPGAPTYPLSAATIATVATAQAAIMTYETDAQTDLSTIVLGK